MDGYGRKLGWRSGCLSGVWWVIMDGKGRDQNGIDEQSRHDIAGVKWAALAFYWTSNTKA